MRDRRYFALLGILALAVLFRFPNLLQHDVADDEALMAYRSVGWLDTWFGSLKSPVDFFQSEQWWQKFSFHDHPPLLFFVEHQFFQIFGPTVMALRLPFAIAGVVAVWLIYLVGNELFGRRAGLLAAAALAVTNYAVWLSRVGFQEGLLIMWMLATLWFFLRSLDDPRYLVAVGGGVGLSLLTKYSAVVLLPVILGGYFLFRPKILRTRWAAMGLAITMFCLTPVIVYNVMLLKTRGHFDATLWAMLGQRHADFAADKHAFQPWSAMLDWFHWMPEGFGWPLLSMAVAGIAVLAWRIFIHEEKGDDHQTILRWTAPGVVAAVFLLLSSSSALPPYIFIRIIPPAAVLGSLSFFLWYVARRNRHALHQHHRGAWMVLGLIAVTFLFLCVTPARKQYPALMSIPMALGTGYFLAGLMRSRVGTASVVGILMLVAIPTANGQLLLRPYGTPGVSYLTLRPTSSAYRTLDAWLDRLYQGQPP